MGEGSAAFCMAVCILGCLVGVGTTGVQQWILDGIFAASYIGLIYASRAWWREIHR